MTPYVEYNSNNSGGHWWLTDENWKALETAGWKVVWATHEYLYDNGYYTYEADGTPKLVPLGEANSKFPHGLFVKDGRYLGALAKTAYKPNCNSLREAATEWETVTGLSSTEVGCPCCGQPHRFTLYRDGKYIESGPDINYVATWTEE